MKLIQDELEFFSNRISAFYRGINADAEIPIESPCRRQCEGTWQRMCCPLREDTFDSGSCLFVIELAKSINEKNVENVTCAPLGRRSGAGMKFLSNLFVQIEATDRKRARKYHLPQTGDDWGYKVGLLKPWWAEIDIDGLPASRFVLNCHFNTNGIR